MFLIYRNTGYSAPHCISVTQNAAGCTQSQVPDGDYYPDYPNTLSAHSIQYCRVHFSVVDRSSTFILCRTTDIWYPYTDRWIVRTCVILRTSVTSRIFGLVAEVSQRHTSGIDCTNVARSEFHWFHTDSEIACIYSDLTDWETGASAWRCFLFGRQLVCYATFSIISKQ